MVLFLDMFRVLSANLSQVLSRNDVFHWILIPMDYPIIPSSSVGKAMAQKSSSVMTYDKVPAYGKRFATSVANATFDLCPFLWFLCFCLCFLFC